MRSPSSSQGLLHCELPGACAVVGTAAGCWEPRRGLWLLRRGNKLGDVLFWVLPLLGRWLFCKRDFIPWRRFVHICNDFIKKLVVHFQLKAFALSFPCGRRAPKDCGRIWLHTHPAQRQKEGHIHTPLLCLVFLRSPQGEGWPKQYPWTGQWVGGTGPTVKFKVMHETMTDLCMPSSCR